MARVRDRVFAGLGAALFLGSACAVTVFAIWQGSQSSSTPPQPTQQNTCVDNNAEATSPAPEVYKPTGTITALQSTDLTVGTGPAAKAGDCLVVKYYGTLAKDGTKFDENYTSVQGFAFELGKGRVIPGWDQGLVGMQAGGERRLVIPATLGYGNQAVGTIPANSDLVFTVKLLRIQ